MSELASDIDLPVGSIYTYFENKDALARAVIEEGWESFFGSLSGCARLGGQSGKRTGPDRLQVFAGALQRCRIHSRHRLRGFWRLPGGYESVGLRRNSNDWPRSSSAFWPISRQAWSVIRFSAASRHGRAVALLSRGPRLGAAFAQRHPGFRPGRYSRFYRLFDRETRSVCTRSLHCSSMKPSPSARRRGSGPIPRTDSTRGALRAESERPDPPQGGAPSSLFPHFFVILAESLSLEPGVRLRPGPSLRTSRSGTRSARRPFRAAKPPHPNRKVETSGRGSRDRWSGRMGRPRC